MTDTEFGPVTVVSETVEGCPDHVLVEMVNPFSETRAVVRVPMLRSLLAEIERPA